MRRALAYPILVVLLGGLGIVGCAQSAPAPTPTKAPAAAAAKPADPTKAPAAPTKAAEPTKAASQPTAVPASKVDYPAKGKSITMLLPWPAGGTVDITARLQAPLLEKELGIPVQVVAKPGAGSQVGLTEIAQAKPDGYTIGLPTLPAANTIYMDPERKAVFGRKDLQPVALHTVDPVALAVKADSPYKSVKDLVDAAKANPEKIKVSTTGILGPAHFGILLLQQATGTKFTIAHFEGGPPAVTAVLGEHVDVGIASSANMLQYMKGGQIRVLGIMDSQESKFSPGVKTLEAQGYKLSMATSMAWVVPTGTPKEIVDILSAASKKIVANDDYVRRLAEVGLEPRYMDTAQVTSYWAEMDAQLTPLMELAKKE